MTSSGSGISLLEHFSALKDPRQACEGALSAAGDPAPGAGRDAGRRRRLRRGRGSGASEQLGFPAPLPALRATASRRHDTLNDVVNALDPELFKRCFVAWVEGLREAEPDIVAIDGKTSRRSHARAKGRDPLHLVSAWASRQRLVLGQEAVAGKSNEITAIPLLLERLRAHRRPGHDRRHRLPDQDRPGDPGQGRRLSPGGEGQLAGAARRDRALLRGRAGLGASTGSRPPTATTAGSRSAATPSATTSPGSPPTAAIPASRAFPASPRS